MPSDSVECPQCRPVEEREFSSPEGEGNHAYALLSAANLERMRGHWDEAIGKCVEALRLDPQNASAHSLVGDIYRDQGRREEAIQWFRMALDLEPGNAADQMKLDRLLKPRVVSSPPHPRASYWARIGIPSAVILAFLMMAVGVWALVAARRYDQSPLVDGKEPPPMQIPKGLGPNSKSPQTPTEDFARLTEPGDDIQLRRTLNNDLQKLIQRTGVRVVSSVLVPGDQSAVVTLLFSNQAGALNAEGLLQTARALAACTYNRAGAVNRCVVRLEVAYSDQSAPELVFSGSTTRSAFHELAADAPDSVVAGAFETPWWNRRYFPNPPEFGASTVAPTPGPATSSPTAAPTAPTGNSVPPPAPT